MSIDHFKEIPVLSFESQDHWEIWLEKAHNNVDAIWLRLFKKGTAIPSITYAEAVDTALCFGWIDGIKKTFDETSYIQKFTPRRARSVWSKRNTEHIERLTAAGKMRAAGKAQVMKAKADGRWERAYAPQKLVEVPQDFIKALKKNKKAKTFFDTLNKQDLFTIYYLLHSARKPETRTKRIANIISKLELGEKLA